MMSLFKKLLLSIIFITLSLGSQAWGQQPIPIYSIPMNLDQAGATYILMDNLTSSSYGFEINADNIILDGNGHTINVAGMGIKGESVSGVTVKNLTVNGGGIRFYKWYTTDTCQNISVLNCNVNGSSIMLGWYDHHSANNSYVSGNTVTGGGMFVRGSDNVIEGNSFSGDGIYDTRFIKFWGTLAYPNNGNTFRNNTVTLTGINAGAPETLILTLYDTHNSTITGNTFTQSGTAQLEMVWVRNNSSYNLFENNSFNGLIAIKGIRFSTGSLAQTGPNHHNTFRNNRVYVEGLYALWISQGHDNIFDRNLIHCNNISVYANTPLAGNRFTSNTFYSNTGHAVYVTNNSSNHLYFWNNIFFSGSGKFAINAPSGYTNYSSDYNLFYSNSGGDNLFRYNGISYSTLQAYQQASNKDLNSKVSDPVFMDVGNRSFLLHQSSPAIDSGDTANGTNYPGNRIDIGAYEYGGAPPEDTASPVTAGHSPLKGTVDVPVDANISLHVQDSGDGVDITTVKFYLDGALLYDGSNPTAYPNTTTSGANSDYTLSYNSPTDFNYAQVLQIRIEASDLHSPPNTMTPDVYTLTTLSEPDITPPLISNITSSPYGTSAIISWTTDEPSSTQVEYRLVGGIYLQSALDTNLVTDHTATLTGLTTSTDYEYHVISADSSDNSTVSSPNDTFTTTSVSFTSIYVEAESCNITSTMQIGSDANASGGQYIFVPAGVGESTSPVAEATANITIAVAGDYHLWLLINGPVSAGDALYIGLDGNFDRVFPTQWGNYEWVQVEITHNSGNYLHNLTAGSHQLSIAHGEELARADKMLLTNDLAFIPTVTGPDSTPPVISAIDASASSDSATITWTTDEPSSSQVEYKKSGDASYLQSAPDTSPLTSHSITITGLTSETTYQYHVISQDDSANNASSAPDNTFTTTQLTVPVNLSVEGDPNFSPDNLPAEMRVWYDRLILSMADRQSYVDYNAGSGNIYRMRVVNNYVSAMLAALRATGDLGFLDEAARVMEMARAQLKDKKELPDPNLPGANKCDGTTDGYMSWLYLQEAYPKAGYDYSSSLFCTDDVPLEESMAHGGVAAIAHALHINRQFNAGYGEKADFWVDYLENHFLARWIAKAGSEQVAWGAQEQGGFVKRLAHPISNVVRLGYYLNKITGKSLYLDKANYYADMLINHVQINPAVPSAYIWKHNVWGSDQGYQALNYAEYFMVMVQEMAIEGFGNNFSDPVMEKFAGTFRDVVFPVGEPTWANMASKVDGSGTTGRNMANMTGFSRWDSTGYLLNMAEQTYSLGDEVEAAYAMLALSTRGDSPPATDTTPPAAGGHSPAMGIVDVLIDSDIIVHISDSGDGVDQSTIIMRVEGSQVTPVISGPTADSTLTYNPATDFAYLQTVDVTLSASDLAGNTMAHTYSFTTQAAPDTTPPATGGHIPAMGTIDILIDSDIIVHVTDSSYGVNQSTIIMRVEGSQVTPDISGSTADFTLTYNPATDFAYLQTVEVALSASDLAGNTMSQDVYSFTTIAAPAPTDTTPPQGTITINSGKAFTNSTSLSLALTATDDVSVEGFLVSETTTTPSAGDIRWVTPFSGSYVYELDSGLNETKTVYAWFKDGAGNVSTAQASDDIELDTTPPTGTISILPISIDNDVLLNAAAYWKFDEGSGSMAGDDVGNNSGVITEASWASGRDGNALDFDGINDYVRVAHSQSLDISGAITIEAWVFMDSPGYYPTVISKSGNNNWGYIFEFYDDTRRINLFLDGANPNFSNIANSAVPLNQWTHIVATYDGVNTIKYYFNGNPDGTSTVYGGAIATNSGNIHIGRRKLNEGHLFDGIIDEVVVYNKALSDSEVLNRYTVGGRIDTTPPTFSGVEAATDSQTGGSIDISWSTASDLRVTYNIYYATTSGTQNFSTPFATTQSTSYQVTGLNNGQIYYFVVRAEDTQNNEEQNTVEISSTPTYLPSGAVAYWKFDEGSADMVYDETANANDGTTTAAWTTGKSGNALDFDGTSDYVSVPNSQNLNISGAISIDAWVYMNSDGFYPTVLSKSKNNWGYILEFYSDTRRINLFLDGANPSFVNLANTPVPLNQWTHIVATYDGVNTLQYYFNGSPDGTYTVNGGAVATNPANVHIGRRKLVEPHLFDGSIDEVVIYNRALSSSDVLGRYNSF